MTALSPFNSILHGIAVGTVLVAGSAYAADPAPKSDHGAPAMSGTKGSAHKPAEKPMMLKPAHSRKTLKPAEIKPAEKTTKASVKDHGKAVKIPAAQAATPAKAMKPDHAGTKTGHVAKSNHAVRWAYNGAGGPANWGKLKPDYKSCSDGRSQSPVDIEIAETANLAPLKVHYKVSLIEMINNGHTVQANYGKGSFITVGDDRYDLVQFHFHTPSEHRIAGRKFPMEIHFVHRNQRGQLAVLGVLATFGEYNLAARELWDRLPARLHTTSADSRALINARDLLPENAAYFRYNGSLTTPPCSENVKWMLLQTPVRFSEAQIAKLHRIIGMNARPAQARNSRYLLQSAGR